MQRCVICEKPIRPADEYVFVSRRTIVYDPYEGHAKGYKIAPVEVHLETCSKKLLNDHVTAAKKLGHDEATEAKCRNLEQIW